MKRCHSVLAGRLAWLWILIGCVCCARGFAAVPATQPWDTYSDTWVATDGLGRSLPEAAPLPRKDKYVGIFYFLWLEQRQGRILDNTQLLAANPANPAYGPVNAFHWWGQPLFGYYLADDEAIIRKHAQMLSDAGVDMVIFDVTNAFTYAKTYLTVCRVYEQMRRSGQKTPQIAFITWTRSEQIAQKLYDEFYSKNLYSELWFRWLGKPLILAQAEKLSPQLREYFTVRMSWAWSKPGNWFGDGRDKWTWVDDYPQKPGWHESADKPEQISVCVAQHPTSNIGRSFHGGQQPAPEKVASGEGLCFAEQWKRALEVDPQFVFITGWNEWIAQRFLNNGGIKFLGRKLDKGETFFVDQYNQEFSRDIEPMKGGHGDNYYYQMVANIRRFKGARRVEAVVPRAIRMDGSFEDWKEVRPEFRDTIDDPVRRNHPTAGNLGPAVNSTGRNDIVAAKVSYDERNIYFYVRTKEPLTPHTDPNWMLLFIDVDANAKTGWLGYDFVVNRAGVRDRASNLESNAGGRYQWTKAADIDYRVAGNELEISIPRAALGIRTLPAAIDFKWADNIQQTGEASDFTVNGDAAPNDRFNYRAKLGGK